jgi:SAM-dependent methyltransferase
MAFTRKLIGRAARAIAALPLPLGTRGYCCLCEAPVGTFMPYAPSGLRPFRQPALMAALQVIGSNVGRFTCPRCLSHDRERHMLLYLRATGFMQRLSGMRVLHMAPEVNLARLITAQGPVRYVQGDLFPSASNQQRIDLQQIPYPDRSFDLVVANHVLEHVEDDTAALTEIARVLAPGGHAILQTPYSPVLTSTFADPGIRCPATRLQAYGQEDHVRLYGSDIFTRFAAAGLVNRCLTHECVLPDADAYRHGVNPAEPLFLFEKPEAVENPS